MWTPTDFGGILKIIQVNERYYGANKMQIELFLYSEQIGNKYYEETTELEKCQGEISPEYLR